MSKDYENLMDSLTNTPYLDTPLEYFKILDDDVEEGSLRQQLAGGGVVTRQNFSTKGKVSSPTQSKLDKLEELVLKYNNDPTALFSKSSKTKGENTFTKLQILQESGWKDGMFSVSRTGSTRELVEKQLNKLLDPSKKIEAYVNNVMLAEDALAKDFINPRAHIAKKFGLSYDGEILRRFVKDSQAFKDNKKLFSHLSQELARQKFLYNIDGTPRTMVDVFEKVENKLPSSFAYYSGKDNAERFILESAKRNYLLAKSSGVEPVVTFITNPETTPRSQWQFIHNKTGRLFSQDPYADDIEFQGNKYKNNYLFVDNSRDIYPEFKQVYQKYDVDLPAYKNKKVKTSSGQELSLDEALKRKYYIETGKENYLKRRAIDLDHQDLISDPFGENGTLRFIGARENRQAGTLARYYEGQDLTKKLEKIQYINSDTSIDDFINRKTQEVFNFNFNQKPYSIKNEANVIKNKLNLPEEEAKNVEKILSEFSDTGIKFNTFTGLPEGSVKNFYKGLKNASRAIRSARQAGVVGASFFVPLTIADVLLNIPIIALDTYRGVPFSEIAGTVGLQDVVKDVTGVAVPGTTEQQFYEKYKQAEPVYELRNKLEDWQSTAEQFKPLEISKDGERSGVFLPARYETYPELKKQAERKTEAKEKDYFEQKEKVLNMPEEELQASVKSLGEADTEREKILKQNQESRIKIFDRLSNIFNSPQSNSVGFYGNPVSTNQIIGNAPQYFDKGGRVGYQEAGLVEKLGRGAQALDPRNVPYYAAKGLKGLGSGVEMAVKFPAAAGAAIGESLQKKPTMETLQKFGEAMAPTATDYLSKKFGLEDLIQEKEKELLEKRPGAVTIGNIIELGAELVPPATGYLKLIEDSSSKLYKVIREGQAGKKVDPKDVEEVLELLSDKGVSRRDFLSIVGGTSIYALAKHIGIVDAVKISQKIKPVRMLSKSTTKMPEWFPSMIEKVLDDTGNSIFKQIDEDAVLITNKEMPGIEITKYDNGRLEVLGENNYGAKYYIEYDPAKYLDDGNYFPGDFSATDTRFYSFGPDDYTKENEIVDQVDDIFGGTDKMREYATGQKKKKLTSGEKEAIEAELRAESFTDEID
jgi:hypothetical protein